MPRLEQRMEGATIQMAKQTADQAEDASQPLLMYRKQETDIREAANKSQVAWTSMKRGWP